MRAGSRRALLNAGAAITRIRRAAVFVCIAASFLATAANPSAAAPRPPRRHLAGYLQNGTGHDDAVRAKFTVPTVTCPDTSATFQGSAEGAIAYTTIGGFTAATVLTYCVGTTAAYTATIDVDGSETWSEAVAPGDFIIVEVRGRPHTVSATIEDRNRGFTSGSQKNEGRSVTELGAGALAIGCTRDGCAPAADLTPTRFRGVTFDSQGLGAATRSAFWTENHVREIDATKLSREDTAFTTRWVSTCNPAGGSGC